MLWLLGRTLRRLSSASSSPPPPPPPPPKQNASSFSGFSIKGALIQATLLSIIGGGVYLYFLSEKEKKRQMAMPVKSMGRPKLGGPFTLQGTEGKRVSDTDFRGKFMFLYFGFTQCPDICPAELEKMAKVVQAVDQKFGDELLQPVFISVDPRRDTPDKIKKYCAKYHPRLVGLTGTMDEIVEVTKAYRVYFSRPDDTDHGDDDYLVDHSIIMYLMDPQGEFVDYFGKNLTAEETSERVIRRIQRWKEGGSTTQ